ncbi:MAG: FadR family transcriptional regulator [Sedimentisphaerales bacterium]|nr:FadR family transcriptional regulator [Sedimentisphaerales bacterium]
MGNNQNLAAKVLFEKILDNIRLGIWPIGSAIPSERTLVSEFNVSRITVREALSMLKALGAISTSQGKRSVISPLDSNIISRLFPLMMSLQGEKTYEQIFEVRLAIESRTAYLAAVNRTEDDIVQIKALLEKLRIETSANIEQSIETDLQFHIQIAKSTQNPLFPALLNAISGFVTYVQVLSCRGNPVKRKRAMHFHETIADAIIGSDPERARVEMESHLRGSADKMLKSGMFKKKC